jgi:hypothetical protein
MDIHTRKLIREIKRLGDAIENGNPQRITDLYLFHLMPLVTDLEERSFEENDEVLPKESNIEDEEDDIEDEELDIGIEDEGCDLSEHDED